MKAIGEFASVPGTSVSFNSAIRLTTVHDPLSWSFSKPGHSVKLSQESYSKEFLPLVLLGWREQLSLCLSIVKLMYITCSTYLVIHYQNLKFGVLQVKLRIPFQQATL